jgi:uncharacterized protein YdaU (DUF1376 family)
MQLYVADYLADTAHLTTEEHGAYLLLIFNYWQTGKSLRKDRLAFVARLSNERWNSVEGSLKDFFHDDGKNWVHFRVESDLAAVNSKSKTNSVAGKASAKARAEKKAALERLAAAGLATDAPTDVPTNVEQTLNHTYTYTDLNTKIKSVGATGKRSRSNSNSISVDQLVDLGVDRQHARDWMTARKAALTKTALDAVANEAEKAGVTLAEAVRVSAERGWRGFKAEWYKNLGTGSKQGGKQSIHHGFDDIDYSAGLFLREDGSYGL